MADLREPTCGDCLAFTGDHFDDQERIVGNCRFRPELGEVLETFFCDSFRVKSSREGKVRVPVPTAAAGRGRARPEAPPPPTRATLRRPTTGDTDGEITVDKDGLKQALREILQEETLYGYPQMGAKWHNGELELKPGDATLQSKTIPIDAFFHKVVMIRDRLRVLEAKINSHPSLAEVEKVELQSYITKAYGSLTTLNVLFQERDDQFKTG
jgi:hypothetical protein